MVNSATFSAPMFCEKEMAAPVMRHWLLRLKYSMLLRQRKDSLLDGRRPLLKRQSNRGIAFLHFKVLIGLAASACFLSRDDFVALARSKIDESLQYHALKIQTLKAILRYRGISTESLFERKDLEALTARTGDVSADELISSVSASDSLKSFNSTCDEDSALYRRFNSNLSPLNHNQICSEYRTQPKTVVFDSPGLFVDRILDNSDGIWILSVAVSRSASRQAISPSIWAHLVYHFSFIKVQFGIVVCEKLEGICEEYGFEPSNLMMAVPVANVNLKRSVKFQRFDLTGAPTCNDFTFYGRKGCIMLIDHVTAWLQNALSHNVESLTSVYQLRQKQQQQVQFRRFKPLQVIWIPGERLFNKSYPITSTDYHLMTRPPLSLSVLSVAYWSRASFWRFDALTSPVRLSGSSTQVSPQFKAVNSMLLELGCSVTTEIDKSIYILLTPEGFCSVQSVLSFQRLNNVLRWNYPSASDLLIFGIISLNTVIILVELVRLAVHFLSSLQVGRILHSCSKFIPLKRQNQSFKENHTPLSALDIRINLITSIVKATFAGWKNYTPKLISSEEKTALSWSQTQSQRLILFVTQSASVICGILFKLFLVNLLFLLSALPIVNLMNHVPLLASFLLYSLRLCVSWFNLANLSPAIFTVIFSFKAILSTLLLIVLIEESMNWIVENLPVKWYRSSSTTCSITTPVSTKLRKINGMAFALSSPALLARYLVLSDDELSTDSRQQSSFSISDGEVSPETTIVHNSVCTIETRRLHRKALGLNRAVNEASKRPQNSLQTSQHLLSPKANQPTKLFLWKFAPESVPADKLTRLKQAPSQCTLLRSTFKSRGQLQESVYDGDSESDGNSSLPSSSGSGLHRRRRTITTSHNEESQFWPSWIIPCEKCAFCWREFETGILMAALSCGHAFHAICLKSWLDIGQNICPVCRWQTSLSHNRREKELSRKLSKTLWKYHRTMQNKSGTLPAKSVEYAHS